MDIRETKVGTRRPGLDVIQARSGFVLDYIVDIYFGSQTD